MTVTPSAKVDPAAELGWIAATNAELGLVRPPRPVALYRVSSIGILYRVSAVGQVFGYCWKRADYPWISLWCCEREGGYLSRGIEFGTTGLHKPFPVRGIGVPWDASRPPAPSSTMSP
jgi:hypothetical protein